MKTKVTPIKTQGKKTKLIEHIRPLYETYSSGGIYLEPFMGSGAVGFNLAQDKAIFSDNNPHLIAFYNAVKNNELNEYELYEYLISEGDRLRKLGDKHYKFIRERYNEDGSPLDFLFLNRSCFNGLMRFNKKGHFNVPFCKKDERFSKSYITKIINEVKWVKEKIEKHNWSFIEADFRDIISLCLDNDKVFIYLDPPYIDRNSNYYNSWTERDEEDLFRLMKDFKGSFILSTWIGNEYRDNQHIKDRWSMFDVKKIEHHYQVGAKTENRKPMIEGLFYKINNKDRK